jgi:hypothetical protein
MYPACLRGMAWPLALMKYADRLPITGTRLGGAGHNSGFSDPRLDRDRHQVTITLAIEDPPARCRQVAGVVAVSL